MSSLKDWIEKETESENPLLICHTTKWKYFENIIKTDSISTMYSKFPNPNPENLVTENLVYLFYGLPFYIYEVGDGKAISSEVTEDLPIGIIMNSSLALNVDRFYPFDTGALLSNMYTGILDANEESEYKVYEVPVNDGSEMRRFIKRYFDKNFQYCMGNPSASIPIHPKEEKLLTLLKFNSKSNIDLRFRAIEIHSKSNIELSKNIYAIILPRTRSKKYPELENEIKAKYPHAFVHYYNDYSRYSAQSIRASLMDETMRIYYGNGNVFFN